jgi:hypothetical protein
VKKALLTTILCISWELNAQVALPTFQAVQYPPVQPLYSFSSHTFTNCGATGRYGPTLANCKSSYNTSWENDTDLFNVQTQGIQEWTVPQTGSYTIEVWGAEGGSSTGYSKTAGKGARMKGTFSLVTGSVLKILVGQQGPDVNCTPGGGGGTFVTTENNTALIVAGGGGGASTDYNGIDAVTSTSGAANTANSASGGTNGNGGGSCTTGSHSGGGGGGLLGDGSDATTNQGRGYSFLNGGTGGNAVRSGGQYGGFGGGGGASNCTVGGGGGGGYSGGAGGEHYNECGPTDNERSAGGGGGSYNNGSSQSNSAGIRENHGQVIITLI